MTMSDLGDRLLVGFLIVALVALGIMLAVLLATHAYGTPAVKVSPPVEWCDGSAPTLEEVLACLGVGS